MVTWKPHEKLNLICLRQGFAVPAAERERAVHNDTLRYSLMSACALALAGLGDSFLYVYLPANFKSIGLTVFWVGILLSVNRFTRLFLNSSVAYYLSKFGLRKITIATSVIAALTTFSYGIIDALPLWITARIIWGLSFSTLRLSSMIYALQHNKKGISLGLSKSVSESGSVLALLIGPILIVHFDREMTFLLISIVSAVGIIIAIFLPEIQTTALKKRDLLLSFPSSLNVLVLLNTFAIEGMMVVCVGQLLLKEGNIDPAMVIIIAGSYLAYRRACLIIFSPISGWLADRWGFQNLFNLTSASMLLGIILVAFGFTTTGLLISFTFAAMNAAIAPGSSLTSKSPPIKDISDNATWRDLGAACGTLGGSLLLNSSYLHSTFLIILVPITAALVIHLSHSKKTIHNGIS
jgi:MFS family permease